MKHEIFEKILQTVCDVCEIAPDVVLGKCKSAEVLHARTLFMWYCNEYGLCANDIAVFCNRRRVATVYMYLGNYRIYRKSSTSFRIFSHEIGKKLSVILPESV